MKKIIIAVFALLVTVTTVSGVAHAASSFNSPGAMPTVTVTNAVTHPCSAGSINGCWQTSTTAVPGDVIAVHVFYHNTSNEPAEQTTLAIQPSRNGTNVSFYGGVASISGPRATGTATATLSQVTTITYMGGPDAACWKPSANSACQPVNSSALFGSSGFNIGTVYPGQQGTLVARFRVDGVTTPTDEQCRIDTFNADDYSIDNGDSTVVRWTTTNCSHVTLTDVSGTQSADGNRTVSPNSTMTYTLRAYDQSGNLDDSETLTISVNTTNNNACQINSFNADDYSIDDGDSTVIRWTTTDCDYVTLTSVSGSLNEDGTRTVSPSSDTTYTLRAYRNGSVQDTRTLTISVDDNNNEQCDIDSFNASPSTINRGSSSTLRWYTNGDVDYVTISGFSGERSEDGSVTVNPYSTTTYTLRVYCNNGDTQTDSETIYVNNVETTSAPQAITTVATVLGGTQARLNGIAVPNNTSATAWFEWGTTGAFGQRTNSQSVGSGSNSQYYSDLISGLAPGGRYYYRAVVQNQYGTAYGDTVSFQTTRTTTTVPVVQTPVRNVVVSQSAPSLLELSIESNYDRMCINGNIDYTISYKNISNQTLEKTVLRFTHPKEITYMMSSRGNYEVVDRTMTIDLGSVAPGESGTVTVHARVNDTAIRGNLAVATATVVYTNAKTRGQEDAIAYSLITVSNDCPNLLGASTFGFGSFLPNTLLGWLLLVLVIFALIVLARNIYRKKE